MNPAAASVLAEGKLRDDETRVGRDPKPSELIFMHLADIEDRETVLHLEQFISIAVVPDETPRVDDHPDVSEPVLIDGLHIR
jgi:hypothetical protein